MSDVQAAAPRGKKVRPPPRAVVVEAVERVTPGVMRVVFGGPELATFAAPKAGAHIKILFVPPGKVWPTGDPALDAVRPPSRTYTPRRFDAATGLLEVEFVLHGEGIAARWAAQAKVGEKMLIGGPGGGYEPPEGVEKMVIIADDSAVPAVGMVLEALPKGCPTHILCEVANPGEARALSPDIASNPVWLYRDPVSAAPGVLLEAAVAALPPQPANTWFWVACEAASMRRIREILVAKLGVERDRVHTRGYWKAGDANYPDHDYGAD